MKKQLTAQKIISIAISVLLSALLLFLYFDSYKSPVRLLVLILMTFSTFILPKKISFEGFFRSLAVLTAILPRASFHVNIHDNPFDFTGFKAFAQVVILYSNAFRILIPAVFLLIIIYLLKNHAGGDENAKEPDLTEIKYKRHIPVAVLMLILFVISCILNPLSDICLFAFDYFAVIIISDLSERLIYKDNTYILSNLPYFFLALCAYFRMR